VLLRRDTGILAVLCAVSALAAPGLAAAAPATAAGRAAQRIVVRFQPGVSPARRSALLAQAGARPVRTLRRLGLTVARVPASRRSEAVALLRSSGATRFVSPEHAFRIALSPTDPEYATTPWPFTQLGLTLAWDTTTGSSSVIVAVLDTGVAPGALDLAGRLVAGYDIAGGDTDPSDDHGHGTEVASTLAGGIDNGFASVGACPLCRIMPVKVMDAAGGGTTADIAAGITWATDHGARIINMSLGGPSDDPALDAAVGYAIAHDVLVVAAAGNNGTTAPEYPAAIPGVVSVAATDGAGALQIFSEHGSWVDVAAPGCVTTATMTNATASVCGTSFAAPLVAGVAGLTLSNSPSLSEAQLRAALEANTSGHGTIDVANGIVNASSVVGPPAPSTTPVGGAPAPGRATRPPARRAVRSKPKLRR
jgi:subtilisin family serine protease